nr:DDE-type integrase/transposase/recombinase [Escherichia coli]
MWPDNRIARDAHYLYRYDRHGRLTEKTDLIPEGVIRTDDERFLGKALRGLKHWEKPATLNTDKAPSYGAAITELKREGKLDRETAHRQVKYLNNVIEADHGKLKILIKPVRGFKSIPTAYATIKGFEVMRALRKGQARPWCVSLP